MKPVKRTKRTTKTTPAPSEPNPKTETKTSPLSTTTIEAKIDVGFGNNLFLRGEGAGLSWERGVPLKCVDGQTWQWSANAGDRLRFKLLLNDMVWARGEDLVAAPGQRLQISPVF